LVIEVLMQKNTVSSFSQSYIPWRYYNRSIWLHLQDLWMIYM
jgi:hypothetical protein